MRGVALFDIDGTLTATNEVDRDCFLAAFLQEFAITEIDSDWLGYEQTTDRGITAEILRRASRSESEEELARHRRRFVDLLRTCAQQIRPIAGAAPFLDRVERAGWEVAIVTGAWSDSARVKLEAAGVDPTRFRVGAYGSDAADRGALPVIAVRRAEPVMGRAPEGGDVVIIGDTPADVTCGRSVEARAIGVGTGHYTRADLLAAGAYAAFESFVDLDPVLDAIFR